MSWKLTLYSADPEQPSRTWHQSLYSNFPPAPTSLEHDIVIKDSKFIPIYKQEQINQ